MEQKLIQLQAKLEADSNIGTKLLGFETQEEVQSFLKEQGIEFTLEEISTLKNALVKTEQKGELTDEDLEEVAGGIVVTTSVLATTFGVLGATASVGGLVNTLTRSRW